jgi:arylsulfatase A-like enzyme
LNERVGANMKLRLGIVLRVGVVLLSGWWSSAGGMAAEVPPPNVVVFLVDDMGVMDTSVPFLTASDGPPVRHPLNDFYRTPAMERLARQGVRFNQFSAMSVCSPTRISIMTGQNAARHRTTTWIDPDRNNAGPSGPPGWNWEGLKPGDVTLAGLLNKRGYRTIHVGKGHFAPRAFAGADPAKLGFDINVGGGAFGAPGSYYGTSNFGLGGKRAHHAVPGLDKYHGQDIFLTEALTLEACAQVSLAVDADEPFFLYLPHYAVHAPFESDPRFAANYAGSDKPPAARAFATLIEGMDKSLGDLLDHLERLGVAENTLVLFLGDNGSDAPLGHEHAIACAAPLRGKKGSHYEGGTRVPFIAAWGSPNPDHVHQRRFPIPAGAIRSRLANVCDLFPTILRFVGAEIPSGHVIDGVSLERLFADEEDPQHPRDFLMHFPHAPHRSDYWTSYRDGDWKVIYHYFPAASSAGGKRFQLFDLANDPSESNDLAEREPGHLRRLMGGMIAALAKYDALYPLAETDRSPVRPQLP